MVLFSVATLVYLAFIMDMLGFLARDELKLRLMMLAGMIFYIAYFFLLFALSLWLRLRRMRDAGQAYSPH